MLPKRWQWAGWIVVIGVVVGSVVWAGREKQKKGRILSEIKTIVQDYYPGATIKKVAMEEEGMKVYEVELVQDGHAFEITVAPDGTLIEVESEVAEAALPPAVAAALAQAVQGGKIKELEQEDIYAKMQLVKLKSPQTVYEAVVTLNGQDVEISLSADGQILSNKVDDGEDDDGDDEEDEQELSIDEVPAAVKATLMREAAGGTLKEIDLENEDGQTVYEADVIIDGKEVEIQIAPDGSLLGKEVDNDEDEADDDDDEDEEDEDEQLSLDAVPEGVKSTILKEAAGGTLVEIERDLENGQEIYKAEFQLNGVTYEIKMAADGTLLKKAVDDEDDEDDDEDDEEE